MRVKLPGQPEYDLPPKRSDGFMVIEAIAIAVGLIMLICLAALVLTR